MTAHTPGPWKAVQVEPHGEMDGEWEVVDGFGTTATVYGEEPEAEANARLIAAAPDLLVLVKRMDALVRAMIAADSDALDVIRNMGGTDDADPLWNDARALLATLEP